jgi:chromosome segregation protein
MDDVIFAGTSKRPALGRAEVVLTIDNSAGLLPIEFSEVSVSRTLFRSGESEYAINGINCRLLDVQDLLSDAGVGRQQHVIVSQGQIDAVLNARPEDRRAIIEEASGVLKHRKRKEKAERRLEGTEANLLRAQDLLREVRRQLRPLERQADAARRHGAVAAEMRNLQLYIAGREIAALRSRLENSAVSKVEGEANEKTLRARLSSLQLWLTKPNSLLAASLVSATIWCASSSCWVAHVAKLQFWPSVVVRLSAIAASWPTLVSLPRSKQMLQLRAKNLNVFLRPCQSCRNKKSNLRAMKRR